MTAWRLGTQPQRSQSIDNPLSSRLHVVSKMRMGGDVKKAKVHALQRQFGAAIGRDQVEILRRVAEITD